MNSEFRKHLDEIRDYVAGVAPEARAVLTQTLVERLLMEFKPGHFSDRLNVFRQPTSPTNPNPSPEA